MNRDTWRMTEAQLLGEIISLCAPRGISLVHNDAPHHSKRRQNLIGFPDIFLCGPRRVAFRELKKQDGRTSPEQTTWKWRLLAAEQDYDIWRPADLESGRIERELDLLTRKPDRRSAGNPSGPGISALPSPD